MCSLQKLKQNLAKKVGPSIRDMISIVTETKAIISCIVNYLTLKVAFVASQLDALFMAAGNGGQH